MTEYRNSQGVDHREESLEGSRDENPGESPEVRQEEESEAVERRSFFQRLLFGDADEEGGGYSREISAGARELEESEEPRELHGFTVERAASVIKDMPDDVPQKSAVRIVRQTLAAAGIEVGELGRATRMREAKLESRIELSRGRVDELNEKTDDVIGSLQEQIEKAREARDYGVSEEERKIGEARDGLSDVDLVRGFFDIQVDEPRSEVSSDQLAGGGEASEFWSESYQNPREDETEILDPVEDDTQVIGGHGSQGERYGEDGDEDDPRDSYETRG